MVTSKLVGELLKQNITLTETGDGLQSEAKVLGHLSVLPENDTLVGDSDFFFVLHS